MAFEVVGMSAGDQAAWLNALGIASVKTASYALSSVVLLGGTNQAFEIVAAPGAGKLLTCHLAIFSLNYGGATYTLNSTVLQVGVQSDTSSIIASAGNVPSRTFSAFQAVTPSSRGTSLASATYANKAWDVQLTAGTGFTVGNGNINVDVYYTIMTLAS